MTEQQIKARIKKLQAEIKALKEQLPKKEKREKLEVQQRISSFLRLADAIVNSKYDTGG